MAPPYSQLILVAPHYLAGGRARLQLFPKTAPIELLQSMNSGNIAVPRFLAPDNNLEIVDLSDVSRKVFNEAAAFSNADMMLLIIDAAFGLEKRDLWGETLAGLTAIPNLILAIDNMSLIDWSQERFEALKTEFGEHAAAKDCVNCTIIPVDFQSGQQVHERGSKAYWYEGPSLVGYIESLAASPVDTAKPAETATSDQFAAHIFWISNEPMLPGRQYRLDRGEGRGEGPEEEKVSGSISVLKYRLSPETLGHQAAQRLHPGDVGYGNISLDTPIAFQPYTENREAGRFLLLDEGGREVVAVCLIKHSLRRATNVYWQALEIDKSIRAKAMKQKPCVLWFTGLSGSGKSTIASLLEKQLHAQGRFTYVLDGDNVRHGLCRDLGFTDADRVENLRRISETAKLFIDAGLIVLVSFISPFRSERQAARSMFEDSEFVEIFVDTSLEDCEKRDPKGLYKLARAGDLKNFTGIDSPYEPPENADIHLSGDGSPEVFAARILQYMVDYKLINRQQMPDAG